MPPSLDSVARVLPSHAARPSFLASTAAPGVKGETPRAHGRSPHPGRFPPYATPPQGRVSGGGARRVERGSGLRADG
jgi:hypothetical protein